MWAQSQNNTMDLEPMTEYGWSLQNNQLQVTWDTEENMMKVRKRVSVLLVNVVLVAKTGFVDAKRGTACSKRCQCTNCENADYEHTTTSHDREDTADITKEECNGKLEKEDEDDEFARLCLLLLLMMFN